MTPYVAAHVLSLTIFLPGATALALLGASTFLSATLRPAGLPGELFRAAGLAASLLTFGIAWVGVLGGFDPEHLGLQLAERVAWIPALGVSWFVAVDGISLFLVLLTTGLVPLVLIASWRQVDRSLRSFVLYLLLLETGVLAVFLAQNALIFFLAWQATLVPMYFLIGVWGGSRRVRAATRFLVVSGLGSAVLLVALLALVQLGDPGSGPSFDLVAAPGAGGPGILDAPPPGGGGAPGGAAGEAWLFAAFVLAFGLAMPIVPLHAWLPDAQSEAPPAVTALLAAVGVKMGAYGMLRFALPVCPDVATAFAPWLLALALAGILYGSLLALAQRDLKRLIAWWTIAQLGFVLLGTFSFDVHGLTGAIVAMLSHGLTVTALLLLVGAVAERRGTTDIAAFGGLARPMPVFAFLLGLSMVSAMGAPLSSGFVGEWLVVLAGFGFDVFAGLLATGGWVLAAACLGQAYRRVALGPVQNPENRGLIDLDWRERGVVLALLVPVLFVGVRPDPVLRRVEPTVLELMRRTDERRAVVPVRPPEAEEGAEAPAEAGGAGEAV